MRELSIQLGVATRCGKCAPAARAMLLKQLAQITREQIAAEQPVKPASDTAL